MNIKRVTCTVENCSHNDSNACCANIVKIVGSSANNYQDTCCSSFLDKTTYSTLTNNANGQHLCDALVCDVLNCIHNVDTNCNLNSIDVVGKDVLLYNQTNCSNFMSK